MSTQIPTGLAVSALLVREIVGTECVCRQHAVRCAPGTWNYGDLPAGSLRRASGQSSHCTSFLVLAGQAWHLFTVTQAGQLPGMAAAGLVTGVVLREIAGRFRKRYASIMGTSLDLVLPATGRQRERDERLHQKPETGSVAEQRQVLQAPTVKRNARAD